VNFVAIVHKSGSDFVGLHNIRVKDRQAIMHFSNVTGSFVLLCGSAIIGEEQGGDLNRGGAGGLSSGY
jgi:hypothetical protein